MLCLTKVVSADVPGAMTSERVGTFLDDDLIPGTIAADGQVLWALDPHDASLAGCRSESGVEATWKRAAPMRPSSLTGG
jgi:hypothetical protein